jgi:hypothetical protein
MEMGQDQEESTNVSNKVVNRMKPEPVKYSVYHVLPHSFSFGDISEIAAEIRKERLLDRDTALKSISSDIIEPRSGENKKKRIKK